MGMMTLDDSVIREIEVANNATDSKEEDYHLQIARWLKDYKRLLEQEPCNECRRDILPKYEAKVITHGNCMMCGKELTEGLFLCKECEYKANSRK